ncbi:MAG: response regulator transcription factor [Pseudomonadota bacterium]
MKTLAADHAPASERTGEADTLDQPKGASPSIQADTSATRSGRTLQPQHHAGSPSGRLDQGLAPEPVHLNDRSNQRTSSQVERPAPAGQKRQRTRIAIADKNPVVRAGLRDYLEKDGRFEVIDVVNGGNAFVSVCEKYAIDVGVIGWAMPDMTGSDVLGTVKRRQIGTRVIIYTGDSNPMVLRQAVKDGAWGFINKSDDPEMLIETLVSVARGRLSLPFVDISSLANDPLEQLTKRERELLRALANGLTNEQIAARIGISHNTVKYHLKNLYDKLGVRNRAMAVGLYMTIPEDCR